MPAELYGIEHFIYIGITTALAVGGLLCAKKYAKTEKSQQIFLKGLAVVLLVSILANRLSQVFRYGTTRWEQIIPDSYCGMTSLVLALAVIFHALRPRIILYLMTFTDSSRKSLQMQR